MSRTHRNTPAARIAGGAVTASALLLLAAACRDSGIKPSDVASTPPQQPVVVQPAVEVIQPESGSVIPANVSYADAESTFRTKDYQQAADMFDVYTKSHEKNAWGFYMLGLSAWRAGQLDHAQAAFDDALQLDPTHVKSLVNVSRVLLESDRPADAEPYLTRAIEVDPASSDAYRVLGRTKMLLGDAEGALESYRTTLAIDPEDSWAMNNMGLILIQQGRFEEALRPLARATQLAEGVAVFENNLGIALERTGHYGAAAEAYRATLETDSSYGKAAASLARVEGRDDEPGVVPVTVADLGDDFAREVSEWGEQRVSQIAPPMPSGDSTKGDTASSDTAHSDTAQSGRAQSDTVKKVTTLSKTDSTVY
jgi:Tfp pilus assembly protein PilF